ncbi:MAG: hypothetical protein HUK26_08305, partial [Duodenibacillus sp.]|nr:hypothetical protein [Duodenibacillus sp.]
MKMRLEKRRAAMAVRRSVCTLAAVALALEPLHPMAGQSAEEAAGLARAQGRASAAAAAVTVRQALDPAAAGGVPSLGLSVPDLSRIAALASSAASDIQGSELVAAGMAAGGELEGERQDQADSVQAAAYGIALETARASRGGLGYGDPALAASGAVLQQAEAAEPACEIARGAADTVRKIHLPDLQVCTQVLDRSGACEAVHDYGPAPVIAHADGDWSAQDCGAGCLRLLLDLGQAEAPEGACLTLSGAIVFRIVKKRAVRSLALESLSFDDYAEVSAGAPGAEAPAWRGPYAADDPLAGSSVAPGVEPQAPRTPPGALGPCELSTVWSAAPGIDLWPALASVPEGEAASVRLAVRIGGTGRGRMALRLSYDPALAVEDRGWTPASCAQGAVALADGFARGRAECIDMPALDAGGCSGGVCEKDLAASPLPGVSPLCRRARVEADFGFYKGPMQCWTGVDGEDGYG